MLISKWHSREHRAVLMFLSDVVFVLHSALGALWSRALGVPSPPLPISEVTDPWGDLSWGF